MRRTTLGAQSRRRNALAQDTLHFPPMLCALQGGKAKKAPLGTSRGNNEDQTVEQRYQKKTQLEHILLRPDTYSELPFSDCFAVGVSR